MAFSINTNNAALEALSSLRETNAQLTTTENQVSTGKKVNTAADDPAIYAISQTMSSQVSALSGISTGLQVTAQVVSTALSQASSSASLLATLAQNLSEGQSGSLDASTINQTISKTLSQIDANANGATFKGVNLLSGSVGNGVTSTTATAAQDLNGTLFEQAGFNATSTGLGLAGPKREPGRYPGRSEHGHQRQLRHRWRRRHGQPVHHRRGRRGRHRAERRQHPDLRDQ